MPVRVPLSFRRVVLLAGPLRFRLRRWRFDALRRQIEIAVESADRQTIKEYMGNAAVFVIASSADFKPAEKLLAFAAQRPRDSRLSTISWRSWPPCDYGESTTTKHPVGFVTGITKPLTQHNPVLNIMQRILSRVPFGRRPRISRWPMAPCLKFRCAKPLE